jgi:NAD(P)-dependent dehydrogenase (short-subunit alcohol dehydrogenase family)
MARELGPDGIRVNSVTPGLIQTDITGGKLTPEMKADIIKGIPLNRLGDAKDVANITCSLPPTSPPTSPAQSSTSTAACSSRPLT